MHGRRRTGGELRHREAASSRAAALGLGGGVRSRRQRGVRSVAVQMEGSKGRELTGSQEIHGEVAGDGEGAQKAGRRRRRQGRRRWRGNDLRTNEGNWDCGGNFEKHLNAG